MDFMKHYISAKLNTSKLLPVMRLGKEVIVVPERNYENFPSYFHAENK
jgi:hypothetical protein